MNKKNLTILIIIAALVLLAVVFWPKTTGNTIQQSDQETLDESTRMDTTDDIDKDLDSIDVTGSSSAEFESIDADIREI